MIICGDALNELKKLADNSIDCCVTSPPYYQLRDYGVEGQIGLEKTLDEYISKLVVIFNEVKRVLKPDGTLWINIADSYAGSGKGRNTNGKHNNKHANSIANRGQRYGNLSKTPCCKPKDLLGVPWTLALALRDNGWYLRQEIIWNKPNCMPESVTDRCTKSHESIFLLSKSRKYYFDWQIIQEPCVGFDKSSPRGSKGSFTQNSGRRKGNRKTFRGGGVYTQNSAFNNSIEKQNTSHGNEQNSSGLRRKRSVWTVSTVGSRENHFATFPPKLIEPCILAGCKEGGVVLDPFAGTGTVGRVAKQHNRQFVLIELSSEYIEICKKI